MSTAKSANRPTRRKIMAEGNRHIKLTNSALLRAEIPGWENAAHDRDCFVRISEEHIRRAACENKAGNLLLLLFKQARSELQFRISQKTTIRTHQNELACRAYAQMSAVLFAGINARQNWSNWRTIPRNLNGRLRDSSVKIIDLCCGIGDSTRVLAWYAPEGSELLGLDCNQDFLAHAQAREYRNRCGRQVTVEFRAQSVLDPFQDASGMPLPDGCAGVVNSSGALACHFDLKATEKLANEVSRVLKIGGLALIDTGPGRKRSRNLISIFEGAGLKPVHSARSCLADRYRQVCFRK
jgi:SAM-dependent methyltransferase